MAQKLDILAFGSHPDDVELGCAGTLLSHIAKGKKCGIIDLTRGELGTRGTPEIRDQEAKEAAKILGVEIRENLGLADGFFRNNKDNQLEVIKMIRKYQPDIVLANAPEDRHPDHGKGSKLVSDSCFLAGLGKIETEINGSLQEPWRPNAVYHYIQYRNLKAYLVVDISAYWDKKLESIKVHKSQFYNPESKEPATLISEPDFLDMVKARNIEAGKQIGVKLGEGFITERSIGVTNLLDLT